MMWYIKNALWIAQKQFSELQVKIPSSNTIHLWCHLWQSFFWSKLFIWNLVHLKRAAQSTDLSETRIPSILPI